MARDAKVHRNINTLVTEVICNGEAFHSSSVRQTVRDKVHASHIVDLACNLKWDSLVLWPLNFLAAAYYQVDTLIEPVDTFVAHPRTLSAADYECACSRT